MNNKKEIILITKEELIIFNYIKEYALTLKEIYPRVVGGWVRDKLLKRQSKDIDICINNITGKEFALGLKTWLLKYKNIKVKYAIVEANTMKSKHLETVILIINNFQIDFLNLRTEEYSNSRIPIMKFGSVEEDAIRRDLTINAIYYNIITEDIEDFIGGINDLNNKILKTPMDPIKTFLDDPLRLLRVIRFHCLLNFKINKEIIIAFNNSNVKIALKEKVSNERIGIEIKKSLETKNFHYASIIYEKVNLINEILKPLNKNIIKEKSKKFWYLKRKNINLNILNKKDEIKEMSIKQFTNIVFKLHNISTFGNQIIYDKFIINLYTLLFPYIGLKVGKVFQNVFIVKESLKYTNNISYKIECIEKGLLLLKDNYNILKEYNNGCNIKYINFLRLINIMGENYKEIIILYLCLTKNKDYDLLFNICLLIKDLEEDLFSKKKVPEVMNFVLSLGVKKEEMGRYLDLGKIYWNCLEKNELNMKELLKECYFI